METEVECKCLKIAGHLEAVNWMLWPREYRPSPGVLALADWIKDPYIWLHYVESNDGFLPDDDVLMSTDKRYWSLHDAQRYCIAELHCEQVLFTFQYPNLRMPTKLGSYFWKANTALKSPSKLYTKEFNRAFQTTLKKMEAKLVQMDRMIISDQLINLDRLDYFNRKTFMRILLNIISFQDRLQLVSFENLCCKRLEGVRLIQQLACFNAHSLKYLFLWRFVLPNENPILRNYSYITGSGQYIPRPDSKQCFVRSLGELRNLRVLALEYSYIADDTGGALLSLLPIMKRAHFRLQLMCREEQTPGRANAALGVGGYGIPDTAWRTVSVACPDLFLMMNLYRVRDYDNASRFLTPSIPLREVHLEQGIDLLMKQRHESDISCFVRLIASRYGSSLVTLGIHQWRSATFPLRRVFELMPGITQFYYVGQVEDDVELRRMLEIIACGVCEKLKHLKILVQDEYSRAKYWQKSIESLNEEFMDVMNLYDIKFCIKIYKS